MTAGRPLGDRFEHIDSAGDLLQTALERRAHRRGAADQQHRATVLVCRRNGGDGVRHARAGGDDSDAALARETRVGLRGVAGDLLMTGVDHIDPLVQAAVVDVLDMAAGEGEDHVDPLSLEHPGDHIASIDLRHRYAPYLAVQFQSVAEGMMPHGPLWCQARGRV